MEEEVEEEEEEVEVENVGKVAMTYSCWTAGAWLAGHGGDGSLVY